MTEVSKNDHSGDVPGWPRLYVQHCAHGALFEVARGRTVKGLPWRTHYCAELGLAWVPLLEVGRASSHFIGRVHCPANPEIKGRIERGLLAESAAAVAA